MSEIKFRWPHPIFVIKVLSTVMFFGFLRFLMFFPEGYNSSTFMEALAHPDLLSSFAQDSYFYMALAIFIAIIVAFSLVTEDEEDETNT